MLNMNLSTVDLLLNNCDMLNFAYFCKIFVIVIIMVLTLTTRIFVK